MVDPIYYSTYIESNTVELKHKKFQPSSVTDSNSNTNEHLIVLLKSHFLAQFSPKFNREAAASGASIWGITCANPCGGNPCRTTSAAMAHFAPEAIRHEPFHQSESEP